MVVRKHANLRVVQTATEPVVGYSIGEDVNKPSNVQPVENGTLAQLADRQPRELPPRASFDALPEEKQKRLKHALPYFVGAVLHEPPRILRRLQLLRRWSHEQVTEVLTRSPRARCSHGAGAPSRLPVAVGSH